MREDRALSPRKWPFEIDHRITKGRRYGDVATASHNFKNFHAPFSPQGSKRSFARAFTAAVTEMGDAHGCCN